MSEIEASIYAVVAALVFLGGAALLGRDAFMKNQDKRFFCVVKLIGWIAAPFLLAMFGLAAMMNAQGGVAIINILRLIAISYIAGSTLFVVLKLAQKETR